MPNFYEEVKRRAAEEFYRQQNGNNLEDPIMAEMGFKPIKQNPETQDNGFFDWIKDGADAGMAGALEGQARFVEANSPFGGDMAKQAGDYFGEIAKRNQRTKFHNAELTNPDYWLSPEGATYDISNTVGSGLALGAETYLAAKALALSPFAGAAAAVGTKIPALARLWQSNMGKMVIGNVAQTPFEAISEGGNLLMQMKEEGYSDDEIQSAVNKAAAGNVAFLGLSNLLQSYGATKLLNLLGNEGVKRSLAATVGLGMAGGAATQGPEEGGQTAIQYLAQGKDVDMNDVINSAKAGVVGGGFLGGFGAGGGHFASKIYPEEKEKPNNSPATGNDNIINAGGINSNIRPAPIADGVEDAGLANTNSNLKSNVDNLNTWAYNTFGKDLIVSGGWRSPENNASVNGATNSNHLYGNAVDIDASNFTAEEIEAIKDKAKEMGFNADGEDMYHDRGSGYHLHLNLSGDGNASNIGGRMAQGAMPDFNTAAQFLQDNQYTFDAETNNTIADTLESQNQESIVELYKRLNPDAQNVAADTNTSASAENRNMDNSVRSGEEYEQGEYNPLRPRTSLSNLVNKVKAGQGAKPIMSKQGGITVGKSSELENKLRATSLFDMTKRAFKGDQNALQNFYKLRPEVQETLKRMTGMETPPAGAREFSPNDVGMHLVRNGILNKQAQAPRTTDNTATERGFIPPGYYDNRQKFLDDSLAIDEQRRLIDSVTDAGARLSAEQRSADIESLNQSRAAEWERMEQEYNKSKQPTTNLKDSKNFIPEEYYANRAGFLKEASRLESERNRLDNLAKEANRLIGEQEYLEKSSLEKSKIDNWAKMEQEYNKNKRFSTSLKDSKNFISLINKVKIARAEKKQKQLDYDWYMAEHEKATGKSDINYDDPIVDKAFESDAVASITDRAIHGDKSAQKAFQRMRSDVKQALLNRSAIRMMLDNERVQSLMYDDIAMRPFLPDEYYGDGSAVKKSKGVFGPTREMLSEDNADKQQGGNKKTTDAGNSESGEVIVTGDEFGEYADLAELRQKAVSYYKNNLQGKIVHNKILGDIDIDKNGEVALTGSGRRKMENTSAKINKLLLVKHLPQIISNADKVRAEKGITLKHANDSFYYIDTMAYIEQRPTDIIITLVKRNDGSISYYNHIIPGLEIKKDVLVSSEPESSNEALGTPTVNTSIDNNLSQKQTEVNNKTDAPKIEDFGEKIGGARKDTYARYIDSMSEAKNLDIAKVPLSKSWPEPDYQKLIDGGIDSLRIGFVRSLRDSIPRKPSSSYKVAKWSENVHEVRSLAESILLSEVSGEDIKRQIKEAIQPNDGSITSSMYGRRVIDNLIGRAMLYEAVGHKYSLADMVLKSGNYSVYKSQEFKTPQSIWTVEQSAKSSAFSNFPKIIADGKSESEAIENFKKQYEELMTKETSKPQVDFGVYYSRKTGKHFIGKKIGRSIVSLVDGFKSSSEAVKYKEANYDKLLEALGKAKFLPAERRAFNNPRVGADMRNGEDVTPEMFGESFGFRGVEFGNWVENELRQANLNAAYDALMDLAGVLDISTKALSLNGELGLAFGARGKGGKHSFNAHYEPGRVVINLTKERGAGSLAHEWWHALDNYFARIDKNSDDYITTSNRMKTVQLGLDTKLGGAARDEMIAAFADVFKAIASTKMQERGYELDKSRSKDYWSTNEELGARAFESYIVTKLQDQSASNDYLANIVSPDVWEESGGKSGVYQYPTTEEMPQIRAAFDNLFNTIEEKETDKGVAVYSVRDKSGSDNQMAANDKLNADEKAWADNLEKVFKGTFTHNSAIKMMQTPLVLQNVGLEGLPIVMHPSKLKRILKEHPEMSPDILKQIPSHIADPMAVLSSDTVGGRIVVALELTDAKGANVVVPIELSKTADEYDANIATSAYGKLNSSKTGISIKWFKDRFEGEKSAPLYLNNKKITNWYLSNRLQLPYGKYQSSDFFANTIPNENDLVKLQKQNPDEYSAKQTTSENIENDRSASVEVQKSLDDMIKEMQIALPNAKVFNLRDLPPESLEHLGMKKEDLAFRLPNGTLILFSFERESLIIKEGVNDSGKTAWGLENTDEIYIDGFFKLIDKDAAMGKIMLSGEGGKGVAFHEVFHAALRMALNTKEKAILFNWEKSNNNTKLSPEEWLAEQYKFRMLWRSDKSSSPLGKIFLKIFDFAGDMIRKVFPKFNEAAKVFRGIESGKIWERSRNNTNDTVTSANHNFSLFSEDEQKKWQKYGKDFKDSVAAAIASKIPGNTILKVCDTPLILQELGIPNLPIKMRAGIAANTTKPEKSAEHAHGLTLDMLEQIPQALNDPVFVMKSATHEGNIVVFTDVRDNKNRSVIVPIAIQQDIGLGKVANVIKTIYGRNAEGLFIAKQFEKGNVLYANTEKSLDWLGNSQLQLLQMFTKQSSLLEKSIADKHNDVNFSVRESKDKNTANNVVDKTDIVEAIGDLVSIKVGGVVGNTADDKYNVHEELGRVRNYGSFDEYSGIIAQYIDSKLGVKGSDIELVRGAEHAWRGNESAGVFDALTPEQKRVEGIAEFGRLYLRDSAEAAKLFPDYYKAFEAALNSNAKAAGKIGNIKAKMQQWYKQSPLARARAGVTQASKRKKTFRDKIRTEWGKFYSDWFDDKDVLKKAVALVEARTGEKISFVDDPYRLARMANSSIASRAELLITGGKNKSASFKALNEVYNGAIKHEVTYRDVLEKIGIQFMETKYGKNYFNENFAIHGFKDWNNVLGTYLLSNRIIEIKKKYADYTGPISVGDAREFIRIVPNEIREAADLYYKFNDNLLSIMRETGLLEEKLYKALKFYENYCPLLRDFSDEAAFDKFFNSLRSAGYGNISNGIKRLTEFGSERTVVDDPLVSMLRMTGAIVSKSERNMVARSFVNLSSRNAIGDVISKEPDAKHNDAQKSIFTVLVDGKTVGYRTTPELYEALTESNRAVADSYRIFIERFARDVLRTGATISPGFIVRNFIRDTISASINSKTGFAPVIDSIKGAMRLLKDPEFNALYQASGADMSTFFKGDKKSLEAMLDDMAGGDKWYRSVPLAKQIAQLYSAYENFGGLVENSTRAGEFARALDQGMSIQEAGYLAKEISLDFSRAGSKGRILNQKIPFFNAVLQGGDKFARTFKDNPQRAMTMTFMYIMLPSLILWCMNHDDDWYKELPEETKNGSWAIGLGGGKHLLIPKPQEVGILFGSALERVLDSYYKQDPAAIKAWARDFLETATPSLFPALYKPIIEWIANYSFFSGRAIVSKQYQNLPPEMQRNLYTTNLARLAGKIVGTSPMKVDHAIRGYSGTAGAFIAQSMDPLIAAGTKGAGVNIGSKGEAPEKYWNEMPFIGNFVKTNYQRAKSVNDWYDLYEKIQQEHNAHGVKGNPLNYVKQASKLTRDMNDINKIIRSLNDNTRLSAVDKRKQVEVLEARKLRMAQIGLKNFSKFAK